MAALLEMIYTDPMGIRPRPPASIIAAGVIAILGSLLVLAGTGIGLFTLLLVKLPATLPEQPAFAKTVGIATMAVAMACSIFGIATAVGLFLLRNWARLSAVVWAGICFCFGLIGIPIALFISIPTSSASPGLPANFALSFRLILLAIYGVPLAVGIWWLILFNRKAVKEQFAVAPSSVDLSLPQTPRCPTPVTVLAWFFITSLANLAVLPFLPFKFPALMFGRLFYPPAGTIILVVSCALVTIVGVGLLKLKLWSYSLSIGLQLVWLASGIITVLNPNFDSLMNSMMAGIYSEFHLPAGVYAPMDILQHMRLFMYIGLLIPIAIVGMLFYYRERFLEASAAAKS